MSQISKLIKNRYFCDLCSLSKWYKSKHAILWHLKQQHKDCSDFEVEQMRKKVKEMG